MLLDFTNITTEHLHNDLIESKGISLSVLRLDKIHPIISGNKLFKLYYFLEAAKNTPGAPVITFGGAYSNHLVATAFACKKYGIASVGIVRGEEPANLSHTLANCIGYGMQLKFISREQYALKDSDHFKAYLKELFGHCIIIPEGGFSAPGAEGASMIMDLINEDTTHICSAVGTATTIAGLIKKSKDDQKIVAIPVLKGMADITERINYLLQDNTMLNKLHTESGYHFGGYAKSNPALFGFMNTLFEQHHLPTDFVYTGKMMYAVFDLIKKDFFDPGSKILCLHTGGLQGNLSLQKGVLTF